VNRTSRAPISGTACCAVIVDSDRPRDDGHAPPGNRRRERRERSRHERRERDRGHRGERRERNCGVVVGVVNERLLPLVCGPVRAPQPGDRACDLHALRVSGSAACASGDGATRTSGLKPRDDTPTIGFAHQRDRRRARVLAAGAAE
jgi:hypothetical protein